MKKQTQTARFTSPAQSNIGLEASKTLKTGELVTAMEHRQQLIDNVLSDLQGIEQLQNYQRTLMHKIREQLRELTTDLNH